MLTSKKQPDQQQQQIIEQLKKQKLYYERKCVSMCQQMSQLVAEIESFRERSNQLFHDKVREVLSKKSTQLNYNNNIEIDNSFDTASSKSSCTSGSKMNSVSSSLNGNVQKSLDQLTVPDIDQLLPEQINDYIDLLYKETMESLCMKNEDISEKFESVYRTYVRFDEVPQIFGEDSIEKSSELSQQFSVELRSFKSPPITPKSTPLKSSQSVTRDKLPCYSFQNDDSFNLSFVTAKNEQDSSSSDASSFDVSVFNDSFKKTTSVAKELPAKTSLNTIVSSLENNENQLKSFSVSSTPLPKNIKKRHSMCISASTFLPISTSPPSKRVKEPLKKIDDISKIESPKTVQVKSYDEITGKETYEQVVLRPVSRTSSHLPVSNQPTTAAIASNNSNAKAKRSKSPDNIETMSFANRRNMWERRSLGRNHKFRFPQAPV